MLVATQIFEIDTILFEPAHGLRPEAILPDTRHKSDLAARAGCGYRLIRSLAARSRHKFSTQDSLARFRNVPHLNDQIGIGTTDDNNVMFPFHVG